jgi:hypothetical protein
VEKIACQVVLRYCSSIELSEIKPTDLSDLSKDSLYSVNKRESFYDAMKGPVYKFTFFDARLEYIDGPFLTGSKQKQIRLTIENKSNIQENINIKWYTDDGWSVAPVKCAKIFAGTWFARQREMVFELSKEVIDRPVNRFTIELTIDGRHTAMLIPVVLLEGSFAEI